MSHHFTIHKRRRILYVQIYDVTAALNQVQDNQSTTDSVPLDALFTHRHESEGFALDWSRVKKGLLASGERCRSK